MKIRAKVYFAATVLLVMGLCIVAGNPVYSDSQVPDPVAASADGDSVGGVGEEEFETTLQKLLAAQDPRSELAHFLRIQVSIYYRAAKEVRAFDQEVNDALIQYSPSTDGTQAGVEEGEMLWDLRVSPSYQRVNVMWRVSAHSRERLVYFYRRLLEMRVEKGISKDRQRFLRQLLSQYNRSLKTKDPLEALALEDLRQELIEVSADVARQRRLRRGQDALPSIPSYFRSDEEMIRVAKEQAQELERRAEVEAAKTDSEVDLLIEGFSRSLQLPSLEPFMDQAPAAGFEPSSGPQGNINGSTFPQNTWALTYDDGPSSKHTLKALDNLVRLETKATFFWLAQNVKAIPEVVRKVQAAGMAVENHSHSHANLPKLGPEGLKKEISGSTAIETEVYGVRPRFFRCPYGAGLNVSRVRELIAKEGMIHVFWNVDSLDWQDKNPESILERVKKQMALQKRGVVLFHDIHPQSVEASRMLLEWSKSLKGTPSEQKWVTLPEVAPVPEKDAPAIP